MNILFILYPYSYVKKINSISDFKKIALVAQHNNEECLAVYWLCVYVKLFFVSRPNDKPQSYLYCTAFVQLKDFHSI